MVDFSLKTIRYFAEQVLRKRPYIRAEWCQQVLAAPIRRIIQADNRVRFWGGSLFQAKLDHAICEL